MATTPQLAWLSVGSGTFDAYSLCLQFVISNDRDPVVLTNLWSYVKRTFKYGRPKGADSAVFVEFTCIDTQVIDTETGQPSQASGHVNYTFQVNPLTGQFMHMTGLDETVRKFLDGEEDREGETSETRALTEIAIRQHFEGQARDIWLSLAEAWVPATVPFKICEGDPSTLTTRRLSHNSQDACEIEHNLTGDSVTMTERLSRAVLGLPSLREARLSPKQVTWTQRHVGRVAFKTLMPMTSWRSESFKLDFENDGVPCFYLRTTLTRDYFAFMDVERRLYTHDYLRNAVYEFTREGNSTYQSLVEENMAVQLKTEAALKDAFDAVDLDGSKNVDENELMLALKKLNVNIPNISPQRILQLIDTSGDNQVQWDEFRKFFAGKIDPTQPDAADRQAIRGALSMALMEGLRLEGYLDKQSKFAGFTRWQRRYCVLDSRVGILKYYRNREAFNNNGQPRGDVKLHLSRRGAQPAASSSRTNYCFSVDSQSVRDGKMADREYFFQTPSVLMRDRWIAAINRARGRATSDSAAAAAREALGERLITMALSLARGLPPRHVLLDGSLTVTVTSATDLPAMDRVSGRSDPFVYIIINGEKVARTKKMANTLRPEWDQTFELDIVGAKSLDFRVMDYDRMTTNDYCAMGSYSLVRALDNERHTDTVPLDPYGCLNISVQFRARNHSSAALVAEGGAANALFGVALADLDPMRVTQLLQVLTTAIATRGLDELGLYRLAGSNAAVRQLREQLESVRMPGQVDLTKVEDVHEITSVLKLFFRNLPGPVFPVDMQEALLEAFQQLSTGGPSALGVVANVINGGLSDISRQAVRILFSHLHSVGLNHHTNKMTFMNLSTCFSPTLFHNVGLALNTQTRGIELMLQFWNELNPLLK